MGEFIYLLLGLTSIVGLAFIVERGFMLRWNKVVPREIARSLAECRTRDDVKTLCRVCEQKPSPLGRLLLLAANNLDRPKADNVDALQTAARHEIVRLDRGLVVLEIIVDIAPLLGLVTQFLRHIERTRLLVHMVDVSDSSGRDDVVKDVEVIVGELASFGAGLEKKPTLMVASKIDVANPEKLKKLKQWATRRKLTLYPISAVTGEGIEKLKYAMAEGVEKVRKALAEAEETRVSRSSV